MRRETADSICKVTESLKGEIAELARLSNIVYNFKKSKESKELERDFFPFSLLPVQIKQSEYEELKICQLATLKLFMRLSEDHSFINSIFADTAKTDVFVSRLLQLFNKTYPCTRDQKILCNVIRNDYMKDGPDGQWSLIEFNAISAGSATTCERLQSLNHFLSKTVFKSQYAGLQQEKAWIPPKLGYDRTLEVVIQAWREYNNPNAIILMVYEGLRQNIADEKEIESAFITSGIRTVEADFNTMHQRLKIGQANRLFFGEDEVALVHFRAGYIPEHYLNEGAWQARLTIEMSKAIKFPTIGMQLINFKRAQADLCSKETLEKYLEPNEVSIMLKHFVPMWTFDCSTEEQERLIQMCRTEPHRYVLKPNLEAGGNNIYNEKILEVLDKCKLEQRHNYVLMRKIEKWLNHTVMYRRASLQCHDVLTEVGVFGGILSVDGQIKLNVTGGNMIKSKVPSSEDGGVVIGDAVFDALMFVP